MYLFKVWFSMDICPESELLGHMVILYIVFQGTSLLLSTVAVQFTLPPTV